MFLVMVTGPDEFSEPVGFESLAEAEAFREAINGLVDITGVYAQPPVGLTAPRDAARAFLAEAEDIRETLIDLGRTPSENFLRVLANVRAWAEA